MSEKLNNEKPLYVLDFDKTLLDTSSMLEELYDAAEQTDLELKNKLVEYNTERLSLGRERPMFQPTDVLGDSKDEVFEKMTQNISQSEKEFIYPDAKRLIEKIQNLGGMAVILTFGNRHWQEAKTKSVFTKEGYDLPIIYTDKKIKSKTILENLDYENGIYRMGSHESKKIVGVGDEITDFFGYEVLPNAEGYLIDRHDKKNDTLPNNVRKINSLDQVELSE